MSTEAMMMMSQALTAFRRALAAEDAIDDATAERVLNRVVWGDPEGYSAHHEIRERGYEGMPGIGVTIP